LPRWLENRTMGASDLTGMLRALHTARSDLIHTTLAELARFRQGDVVHTPEKWNLHQKMHDRTTSDVLEKFYDNVYSLTERCSHLELVAMSFIAQGVVPNALKYNRKYVQEILAEIHLLFPDTEA